MGSIDGTLIIAGLGLALAAIAVGFALGAVINTQRMKKALGAYARGMLHEEAERLRQELAVTLNNQDGKFEVAITTARQARDAVNATAGIVDGLQHGAEQMRETVAGMGLELQAIEGRVSQRNDALLAEIAGPLQAVQQRAINLEHDVRNIEQSLALMARADEPAPRTGAGEQQAEARASSASPPASDLNSSASALADEQQAEEAPANAPPTSPSPAILSDAGDDVVSYRGGFRGGDMASTDASALNFNEKHEPPAGALPAWRW